MAWSVFLLYGTVTRVAGRRAGLLAGLVLALTPVALLMFRYNNPEALLVLLMTAAAYCLLRALQAIGGRALSWMLLAGALLGLGFLTKQMQVFLVVPGFAAAYLLTARVRWGQRVLHLLAAGVAMAVAAGWWLVLVELWPASTRPYIGGSQTNSILELPSATTDWDASWRSGRQRRKPQSTDPRCMAPVHRQFFHANLLADPRRADPAGRNHLDIVAHPGLAEPPGQGVPGPRDCLRHLAGGHRTGLFLHAGNHPPLLLRGPGTSHRGAGRHGRMAHVEKPKPSRGHACIGRINSGGGVLGRRGGGTRSDLHPVVGR